MEHIGDTYNPDQIPDDKKVPHLDPKNLPAEEPMIDIPVKQEPVEKLKPPHTLGGRFDYVAYDDVAQDIQTQAKMLVQELETFILGSTPPGRAQALSITKLEEVYMWIGKAIRDEQVGKRKSEMQEQRTNS